MVLSAPPILRGTIGGIGGGSWDSSAQKRVGGTYSGMLDIPSVGLDDDTTDEAITNSVTITNPTSLPLTLDIGGGEIIPPITRRNVKIGRGFQQIPWHIASGRPLNSNYAAPIVFNDPWSGQEDLYPNPVIRQWISLDNTVPGGATAAFVTSPFASSEIMQNLCAVGVLFAFQNLSGAGFLFRQLYGFQESPSTVAAPLVRCPAGTGYLFVPVQGIVGIAYDISGQPTNFRVDITGWFGGS